MVDSNSNDNNKDDDSSTSSNMRPLTYIRYDSVPNQDYRGGGQGRGQGLGHGQDRDQQGSSHELTTHASFSHFRQVSTPPWLASSAPPVPPQHCYGYSYPAPPYCTPPHPPPPPPMSSQHSSDMGRFKPGMVSYYYHRQQLCSYQGVPMSWYGHHDLGMNPPESWGHTVAPSERLNQGKQQGKRAIMGQGLNNRGGQNAGYLMPSSSSMVEPFRVPPQCLPPTGSNRVVKRSAKSMPNVGPGRECKFCKNNGEARDNYKSHNLRNPQTNALICPVLRQHKCELCGATGDNAHTRNYCPQQKMKLREALPLYLKRTRRQSDGSMRNKEDEDDDNDDISAIEQQFTSLKLA